MESIHGRNRHETVTGCDETCELPPCDHQSRRDTTPLPRRYGCRVEAENAVPHDWVDEASRARREKIEDKGSGRSSGKHAHVVTCTSPLERTSEPKKDTTTTSNETMGRTAEYVRCPSGTVHHTTHPWRRFDRHLCACRLLIGQPIHRRNGGRTPRVMDEASRKKPGRHAGRGTPATSLDSRDMDPCGLPGSSHVVNALRCESVVVDACARQRRRFMVLRRCRGTCQRPQDRFFAHRSPCGEMLDETGSSCSRPLT